MYELPNLSIKNVNSYKLYDKITIIAEDNLRFINYFVLAQSLKHSKVSKLRK